MANSSPSQRIPELDGLRGAAISLVLLFHYFYYFPDASHRPVGLIRNAFVYFERFTALGWTGVDLFFVLSGFLIGGILLDARSSPSYFKTFYLRRFYRIIPLYYGWILCYLVVVAFAGPLFSAYASSRGEPTTSSRLYLLPFFLQNFELIGYSQLGWWWFVQTWSLAVEEQFYLVAPLVIRLFSRRRLYWLLGIVIFSAPFLRLWVRYHISTRGVEPAYELMPCRADALALGILAALLWRIQIFRSWLSSHASVLYGLAGMFLAGVVALGKWSSSHDSLGMQFIGYTWIAGFYTLVLLLALGMPSGPVARLARMGWLRELGRVSYCLYVVHYVIGFLCQILLEVVVRHVESWQVVFTFVPAAVIAYLLARLSWTYFEHPLLRRGHAYRYFPDESASLGSADRGVRRVALRT